MGQNADGGTGAQAGLDNNPQLKYQFWRQMMGAEGNLPFDYMAGGNDTATSSWFGEGGQEALSGANTGPGAGGEYVAWSRPASIVPGNLGSERFYAIKSDGTKVPISQAEATQMGYNGWGGDNIITPPADGTHGWPDRPEGWEAGLGTGNPLDNDVDDPNAPGTNNTIPRDYNGDGIDDITGLPLGGGIPPGGGSTPPVGGGTPPSGGGPTGIPGGGGPTGIPGSGNGNPGAIQMSGSNQANSPYLNYGPGNDAPWGNRWRGEGGNEEFYQQQFNTLLGEQQSFQNDEFTSAIRREMLKSNPLQQSDRSWDWANLPEVQVASQNTNSDGTGGYTFNMADWIKPGGTTNQEIFDRYYDGPETYKNEQGQSVPIGFNDQGTSWSQATSPDALSAEIGQGTHPNWSNTLRDVWDQQFSRQDLITPTGGGPSAVGGYALPLAQ
jgi:hypothetical protein